MSITLHKVARITDKPSTEGLFINTLSWFPNNKIVRKGVTIPSYQLTPYHLKNDKGQIFENIWQFSKLYPEVSEQNQIINNRVIWRYRKEKHMDGDSVNDLYWNWRDIGFNNLYPVRYPNGYFGRHTCYCSLWQIDEEWRALDYLEARKAIYVSEYARLVKKTEAYSILKDLIELGCNLDFIDVDVPGTIKVNQKNYDKYINDTSQAFGHTWALAGCLLDLKMT